MRLATATMQESWTKNVTGQFEGAVRKITGNEEYKFGDITRSFVKAWKVGNKEAKEADEKRRRDDAS